MKLFFNCIFFTLVISFVASPVIIGNSFAESPSFHQWTDKEGKIHFSGTVGEKGYKGSDSSGERLYANPDNEKKCKSLHDVQKYGDTPACQKLLCERYHMCKPQSKPKQQEKPQLKPKQDNTIHKSRSECYADYTRSCIDDCKITNTMYVTSCFNDCMFQHGCLP